MPAIIIIQERINHHNHCFLIFSNAIQVDPNPEISVPEPVSFEDVVANEEVVTSNLAPPTFLIPDQTSTPINHNTNRIKVNLR